MLRQDYYCYCPCCPLLIWQWMLWIWRTSRTREHIPGRRPCCGAWFGPGFRPTRTDECFETRFPPGGCSTSRRDGTRGSAPSSFWVVLSHGCCCGFSGRGSERAAAHCRNSTHPCWTTRNHHRPRPRLHPAVARRSRRRLLRAWPAARRRGRRC